MKFLLRKIEMTASRLEMLPEISGSIFILKREGEFYFKKRIAFHFKLSQSGSISSEAAASQLFNERVKYYDR